MSWIKWLILREKGRNLIVKLFRRVTFDLHDLETYLRDGNDYLLWNDEEDYDLSMGNQTAIVYLRKIKGDRRVEKRLKALVEGVL